MNRWITLFALELAIGAVAIHSAYLYPWTLDDAYISYRYAENFVAGHGLVYNPGEKVEGYTTFLWVMLLAGGHALGVPLDLFSKVLGGAFSVLTLMLIAYAYRIAPRLDPMACALATIITGTCASYTKWTLGGMEVPLTAFFGTLAVLFHLRAREGSAPIRWTVASGASAALAAMSRPESALIFVVCFLDHFYSFAKRRDGQVFLYGAVFSLIFAPYLLWRWSYYGYWVPNTFYCKVGSTTEQVIRGWGYTRLFIGACLSAVAPAFVALLGVAGLSRRYGALHVCVGIAVLHTAFVIIVGGDVMPAFRFYATVLPFFALAGAHAVVGMLPGRWSFAFAAAVVMAFNLGQALTERQFTRLDGVGARGKVVGLWLREHVRPDAVLATNTAGSIPYFSKLKTIDMLGLNDATIAHRVMPNMGKGQAGHEKGDGKYVLSRLPDIVQFGSSRGSDKPSFVGDRELFGLPEFKKKYVLRSFTMPNGMVVQLYILKSSEADLGLPKPNPATK